MEITKSLLVDATVAGNATRLINHCCEPNCVMKAVKQQGKLHPVAAFFANRDIPAGAELTFNYCPDKKSGKGADDDMPCLCGAPKCRGKI